MSSAVSSFLSDLPSRGLLHHLARDQRQQHQQQAQAKLRRPFKKQVHTQQHNSGPAQQQNQVHPCPLHLLVRTLQYQKAHPQPVQIKRPRPIVPTQTHGWAQANVRRQAITVNVQTTNHPSQHLAHDDHTLQEIQNRAPNAAFGPGASVPSPATATGLHAIRKNRPVHRPMAAGSTMPAAAAAGSSAPAGVVVPPAAVGRVSRAEVQAASAEMGAALAATLHAPSSRPMHMPALPPARAQQSRPVMTTIPGRHKRPREGLLAAAAAASGHPTTGGAAASSSRPDADPILEASPTSKRARRQSPTRSPEVVQPAPAAAAAAASYRLRSPPTRLAPASANAAIAPRIRSPAAPAARSAPQRPPSSPTPSISTQGSLPSRSTPVSRSLTNVFSQSHGRFSGAPPARGFGSHHNFGGSTFMLPMTPRPGLPNAAQLLRTQEAAVQQAAFQAQHPNLPAARPPVPFAADEPQRKTKGQLAVEAAQRAREQSHEAAERAQRSADMLASQAHHAVEPMQIDSHHVAGSTSSPARAPAASPRRREAPSHEAAAAASSSLTPPASSSAMHLQTPPRPASVASERKSSMVPSKRKAPPTSSFERYSLRSPPQAENAPVQASATRAYDQDEPMDAAAPVQTLDASASADETEEVEGFTRSGRKRAKRGAKQ